MLQWLANLFGQEPVWTTVLTVWAGLLVLAQFSPKGTSLGIVEPLLFYAGRASTITRSLWYSEISAKADYKSQLRQLPLGWAPSWRRCIWAPTRALKSAVCVAITHIDPVPEVWEASVNHRRLMELIRI